MPVELVGKFKNPEGGYVLYYKTSDGRVSKMSIIMLDTNTWIIDHAIGYPGLPSVIQK